jgi:hypothetical protein
VGAGAAKLVSHFTGWSTVVSPAAVVLALGLLGRGRNLVRRDRLVGAD